MQKQASSSNLAKKNFVSTSGKGRDWTIGGWYKYSNIHIHIPQKKKSVGCKTYMNIHPLVPPPPTKRLVLAPPEGFRHSDSPDEGP